MKRTLLPALREMRAMARQAGYLSLDLLPRSKPGLGPSVVLLHGLYASAGVFRPLRSRLEQELDSATYSFSYLPGVGALELATRVAELVKRIDSPAPIHLVGHSLGGLVARHYASSEACDRRVIQTISLAAPFLGSEQYYLVPGQAGKDIAPFSELLVRLRSATPENVRVPHLTLVAGDDEVIVRGAYPDFGEHVLIPCVGHNGILFHEEAIRRVLIAIGRSGAGGRLAPGSLSSGQEA